MRYLLNFILLVSMSAFAWADAVVTYDKSGNFDITTSLSYFIDSTDNLSAEAVAQAEFTPNEKSVLNIGIVNHSVWLKFNASFNSNDRHFITFNNPSFNYLELFGSTENGFESMGIIDNLKAFSASLRPYDNPNPTIEINGSTNQDRTFLVKIVNDDPIITGVVLSDSESIVDSVRFQDMFFALFSGIMIVMLLYNLFIFITLRTRIYAYYVMYIFLVYIAQASLIGYGYSYLWPNSPGFANLAMFILGSLVIIAGLLFIRDFLNVNKVTPKADNLFKLFMALSGLSVVFALFGKMEISFMISQPVAALSAVFIIVLSIIHIIKGNRQGAFLLIAWSLFFAGVIIFVLKNFSVISNSILASYSMPIGAAIETVLLSFALADRINTLKKQREESQRLMLMEVKKNNDLTRNQNKILEEKVQQRTQELEVMNKDLEVTLADLKSTQGHLVEAEKMASLGQLTAGIAHEINNPINYVSSNVEPIRQDLGDILEILEDYKALAAKADAEELAKIKEKEQNIDLPYSIQEIKDLLGGIEEGAKRTAEIVTGLKNFSRTDEDEAQSADINNGLRSTITILKSELKNIKTNLDYGTLPHIKCYLGKLNQVFMNLVDNAIDAINVKHGESKQGVLTVKTAHVDDNVVVTITDNGCGMDEDTLQHIFDPFYTTKDVGQGTGLGLSISYGIIEKHNGTISVTSEVGVGSTFTITLPINTEANE